MIAAPAVDLKGGRCVQLVGGRPQEERISRPDPVAQAATWWEMGFRTLHIVDLDAALGSGDNRSIISEIVRNSEATLQVGGGIRDEASMEALLEAGAHRVIIGTRAIEEPDWLETLVAKHPGTVQVAADIRDGEVVTKGWTESSGIPIAELLDRLTPLPLAGVLCTDVGREGRMEGADMKSAREVVSGTPHPVWISGGIASIEELRALEKIDTAGAVLGMGIYTGVLPPAEVAKEFGE